MPTVEIEKEFEFRSNISDDRKMSTSRHLVYLPSEEIDIADPIKLHCASAISNVRYVWLSGRGGEHK